MSPASYRAAPPRVGEPNGTAPGAADPNQGVAEPDGVEADGEAGGEPAFSSAMACFTQSRAASLCSLYAPRSPSCRAWAARLNSCSAWSSRAWTLVPPGGLVGSSVGDPV